MEKRHKPQTSFAGNPSAKNTRTGVKKNQEKTHVSLKSNANLDKKPHTQVSSKTTHKPAETVKKASTTKEEVVEKPPVKTEKPPVKTEKPPVKVEKPPTTTTTTKTTSSSSSTVQSALESKKANDEKRDMNKKVEALKKENIELRKKVQEFDTLNSDLVGEMTEIQKSSERFIKERNDMEVICKKAQQELKLISQRNDEL